MKEPVGTRYVPGYDLFKLIVAIILTVILIWLLLKQKQIQSAPLEMATQLATPTLSVVESPVASPTPTIAATSTESPIAEPLPTITETPIITPTNEPTPTTPAPVESTPEASVPSSDPNACPSNPTRIHVGDKVKVTNWLYFRLGPGLYFDIQRTNKPGTELEVIGGPICTKKENDPPRGYLWWYVRMEDGREGWSAEAPLNFPDYFLEPVLK